MDFRAIAEIVLIAALILGAALGTERHFQRLGVPAPLVFLLVGFGLGSIWTVARDAVTPERLTIVGTLALIVILLQGGLDCGLIALRKELAPVLALGLFGTLATFALISVAVHLALGLTWIPSLIIGAILSPTDPAAVFSVLGGWRERGGRIVRLLEGEAGINDPVAISLVIALVDGAADGDVSSVGVIGRIALDGSVGAAIGLLAGVLVARVLGPAWPTVRMAPALAVLAAGLGTFGVATLAHGSGFLAVYLCGLVLGDDRDLPERDDVLAFTAELASLAEIAMFVLLGVVLATVDISVVLLDGLILAIVLVVLVRPAVCFPILRAFRFDPRESSFAVLAGLKGAVPILLAAIPLISGIDDADRIFGIVGVAVIVSLAVQGIALSRLTPRLLGDAAGVVSASKTGYSSTPPR
jgi:potassium/hydrogen antiporter